MAGGGCCRNCCEWLRELLYVHYWIWLVFAGGFWMAVTISSILRAGIESPVSWILPLLASHYGTVVIVVGGNGRWWPSKATALGWTLRWNGGAVLQCSGIGYAVRLLLKLALNPG
ncbi:unnamed protein product [Linum trigynum]|uniref:Uncharacterized protein n=1 Tax=Linum trigynum TaxID=586398 RepID=A0AAV2DEX4_9ROSI